MNNFYDNYNQIKDFVDRMCHEAARFKLKIDTDSTTITNFDCPDGYYNFEIEFTGDFDSGVIEQFMSQSGAAKWEFSSYQRSESVNGGWSMEYTTIHRLNFNLCPLPRNIR